MKIPKIKWIPFDRNNPPKDLNPDEDFLIFLREDDYNNGASWRYSVYTATPYGTYLDGFWTPEVDLDEGQKIEVLAYARFSRYQKETELEEKTKSKWIQLDNSQVHYCESCGCDFNLYSYCKNDYRFCPYCGAPMDIDTNEKG